MRSHSYSIVCSTEFVEAGFKFFTICCKLQTEYSKRACQSCDKPFLLLHGTFPAHPQADGDDAGSQYDLKGHGSPGTGHLLHQGPQDFIVTDHGTGRPAQQAGAGIEDDREAVHELADDSAAADDDGDADEEAAGHEEKAAVRSAGDGQDVIDAHGGVGDDDGLDSPHKAVRSRHVLIVFFRDEQFYGNGQQDEAA